MSRLAILILAVALCACARPVTTPVEQLSGDNMQAWERMRLLSGEQKDPYRLRLSMRFGEEGNTRRMTGLLWGNGEDAFRLDVMAGVGTTVAMISENGDKFQAYVPQEKKAYFQEGRPAPLLKVGVPVPISFSQLAHLLTGRYTEVFDQEPASARAGGSGETIYTLGGPLAGELAISPSGAPALWRQQNGGWVLELTHGEDSPFLPNSLRLRNVNGKMAVILVKERETPQAPFIPAQLGLALPPGTPVLPFSQFKTN